MKREDLAPSGISMARNVRLSILKRTREILDDASRWTRNALRVMGDDGVERYCLLGAAERAAYDLGYAEYDPSNAFDDSDYRNDGDGPLGYRLSLDMSLNTYAREKYSKPAWAVNDDLGYAEALALLDSYIVEVEEGRAREPEVPVEG